MVDVGMMGVCVHFFVKIDIETIVIVELVNFCANFVTATSRKKNTTGLHCAAFQ